MIVAYLRVSTGHQVLDNQKNEIEKYVEGKDLKIDKWVTEVVSSKTDKDNRKLGGLIRKQVHLYSVKDGYSFDDSINSKVLLFAFGLVAEIERNLISMRTREALALRKRQGVILGRKAGSYRKLNILMENRARIERDLKKGVTKASICRKYKVSVSTFVRFEKMS